MREIVASTIWMSPGTRPERTPPGERESGSGPPLEPGDTPAADACSGARPPALGLAKVPPPMPDKRALIIGIAGQDGSYLAELLLDEGYEVFGVVRQPASTRRIASSSAVQPTAANSAVSTGWRHDIGTNDGEARL